MQISQGIRQASSGVRRGFSSARVWLLDLDRKALVRWGKPIGIALPILIVCYYTLGAWWMNRIDDSIAFSADTELAPNQSHAVAIAAALIDREVNDNGWVANDPFFMPAAVLDNMPNYQMGIIAALARFSFELTDQLGRTRGSSQADPDLQDASGLLQYSGTRWVWDPSVSVIPTASSEAQYRKALESLKSYNARLAAGTAVFDKRADNFLATLDRIALDIGSSSAVLDDRIEQSGFGIDSVADDLFYGVKGRTYGYYIILRELRADFANLVKDRDLDSSFDQLLDSLAKAATLQPWVVVNGSPDSQIMPSHLAAQGFYLLRARTQLREITNILLK